MQILRRRRKAGPGIGKSYFESLNDFSYGLPLEDNLRLLTGILPNRCRYTDCDAHRKSLLFKWRNERSESATLHSLHAIALLPYHSWNSRREEDKWTLPFSRLTMQSVAL